MSIMQMLMAFSTLVPVDDLSDFAVNDVEASLALSFTTNEYRTANTATTFADAFTGTSPKLTYSTAAGSNSTMTQGYGPELVTNGGFDTDTAGWTAASSATLSQVAGELRVTNGATSYGYAVQEVATVSGKTYEVTYKVNSGTTSGSLFIGTTSGGFEIYNSPTQTDGLYSQIFTATSSSTFIRFGLSTNTSGYYAAFDNISVREAPKIVWAPHNLVDYSEDFSQWYDVGGTLDATLHEAPDGSTSARKITVNTASTAYTRDFLTIGATSNTFGVYIKGGTASTLQLYVLEQGVLEGTADIDLATGQVSNVSSAWTVAPTATSVGNGWWLVVGSRSFTAAASNHGFGVAATNQNGLTYYIYGAHLYRSDLGGMHPVPGAATGFETYVPTNGSAEYLPRVGHHAYNGSTWVNEGLLIESEPRTNLVSYSEDFADASNTPIGVTVTPNASGLLSELIETTDSGDHQLRVTIPSLAANWTASCFIKSTGSGTRKFMIRIYNNGADVCFAIFDPTDGSVTDSGGQDFVGATTQDMGGGVYRVAMTCSRTLDAAADGVQFMLKDGGTGETVGNTYTGDGSSSIYVGHLQVEAGSTPSSYMPTNGGTYTRTAQSLTVPAPQFGWPEPEYIGPELVDNGTFDTDTSGWTAQNSATLSATGAELTVTNGVTAYGYAAATVTTEIGQSYTLSVDVTDVSSSGGGGARIRIGTHQGGGTIAEIQETSAATVTHTFVAETTTTHLRMGNWALVSGVAHSFDNISVREINPLSVSIQMDGRMTYADEGVTTTAKLTSWNAGGGVYIEQRLDTASTDTGRVSFAQQTGGAYDSKSVNIYTPGVLTPFNISSRHGSTFVNGAVDGVALTADTTPTALPDLSGTNLQIAYDFMGTIGTFRQFAGDIGDAGLVTATNPSTEPTLSLTFDGTSGGSFYNLNWSE